MGRFGPWLLLSAMLVAGTDAGAHTFEHPKTLRIGVRGDRAYLSITFDVNPGPDARRTRGLFDRNADGTLDAAEQAQLAQALERMAWLWLKTEVSDRPVEWTLRQRHPHRLDKPADDPTTLGVALLYELALEPGELRMRIEDREKDKAKHVPVTVDLGPTWHVSFANQGELAARGRQLMRSRLGPKRDLVLRLRRKPPASR